MIPTMEFPLDQSWAGTGWIATTSGTGATSVSGGILTTTGDASSAAYRGIYVPMRPGGIIEVDVMGFATSGTVKVNITECDHDSSNSIRESVTLSGDDWKRYRLSTRFPMKSTAGSFALVTFGVATADAGSGKFQSPIIRVGGGYMGPHIIARGVLQLVSGTASLVSAHPSHGVASFAFNGSDTVTVTLSNEILSNPNYRPHVRVTGTPDSVLIPVGGTVTGGAAPTFVIKWTDGAAFADVSSGTRYAYFEVAY